MNSIRCDNTLVKLSTYFSVHSDLRVHYYQGVFSGKIIWAQTSDLTLVPQRSSASVKANTKAVPGPRLHQIVITCGNHLFVLPGDKSTRDNDRRLQVIIIYNRLKLGHEK
jgi:hypothetical protein